MESSSDWLTLLQGSPPSSDVSGSSWIDALANPETFVEGLPIARHSPSEKSAVDSAPAPSSDAPEATPVSDPIQDAFARGEAAGFAAAKAQLEGEHNAAIAQQRTLRLSFQNLDQVAMDCLASDLADTVTALCERAFEHHTPDADQLMQRCDHAAKRLGGGAQDCALHLNPADVDLVDPQTREAWRVIPDETVLRGGLRFESADGAISDDPSDWRRAIAAAIKG
ncbi:MAG: FliH/SctL family protein [Erythrobacter sp.]